MLEKEIDTKNPGFDVPLKLNSGNGKLSIELLVYYCETENEGICKFKDLFFEMPVNLESTGQSSLIINYKLN